MKAIHPQTRIGHVHLKVADLARGLAFYRDALGFEVTQRVGNSAVFLAAGGYRHQIALNTWESLNGNAPAPGSTGLFHLAILYPTCAELADALRRLIEAGITLDRASDHGVSHALYLRDPDRTGSSFTGIGRRRNGRARQPANWRCTPARWTSPPCWLKLKRHK